MIASRIHGLILASAIIGAQDGSAELVREDLVNPDDIIVVHDTTTDHRWIRLDETLLLDAFFPPMQAYLDTFGYRLATPSEVCQLFFFNLPGFPGPCPANLTLPLDAGDLEPIDHADVDRFGIFFGYTDVDASTGAQISSGRCGSSGPTIDCFALTAVDEAPVEAGAGIFSPLNVPSTGYSAYWFIKVPEPSTELFASAGAGWLAILASRRRAARSPRNRLA